MKLKGRRALVTGANMGLGLAIAKAYAREGADLVIAARGLEALEAQAPGLKSLGAASVLARRLDVSDQGAVRALAAELGVQGPLHVLVNNAGVYGPKGPLEESAGEAWEETLRINVLGVVWMCAAFHPLLKLAGGAQVINLSGGGATAPLPGLSAYAASKAAVVRLTETLAIEWAGDGISVNAVAPGALNTRLLDEVLEAGPAKVGQAFYEKSLKQKQEGGTPLELGAELCLWLATPEAQGISGRLLSAVWDPWKEGLAQRKEQLAQGDIYTLRRIVPKDRGLDWGGPL